MIFINGRFLTQQITGVQRFALQLCLELSKLQVEMQILTPQVIKDTDEWAQLPIVKIGTKTGYWWEQFELPLWMKKNAQGSILLNLCNLSPILYRNNLVVLHDVAVLKFPQWYSKKFYLFYKLFLPLVVKGAKKVVTVSAFSQTEIANYFNVDINSIGVVPNGVTPLPQLQFCSGRWKFKSGEYILGVSSMNERKNLKSLIEAYLEIDTNLHLVLAGEENKLFSGGLSVPVDKKNRIHFLGYVTDGELFSLYSNGFVFVYPSLYEGFGIPPIEAMSCGCPVIASDIQSLREVCNDAAVYVNPSNIKEIKEAILSIQDQNKRQQMIEKGYDVVNRYSWKSSACRLIEIVKGLNCQN